MALTRRNRVGAALVAVASLTACGTTPDDPLLGAARTLASGLFNREDAAPPVDPRQVLTRDMITQAGVPLILVEAMGTGEADAGSAGTAVRVAVNGYNETWQGNGDVTVTLSREGVLRATRGYGPDLSAADIAETRAALVARRAGPVNRVHVHVGGDLQQIRTTFTCIIAFGGAEQITLFGQSHEVTRVTETCRNPATTRAAEIGAGAPFENRYWVDSTGFSWASEQWAGSDLGHLRIERLFR